MRYQVSGFRFQVSGFRYEVSGMSDLSAVADQVSGR